MLARFEFSGIDELLSDFAELENGVPGGECPECGGEIVIPLNADTVTCPHCGKVIGIDHES